MPIYEYRCENDHRCELIQKFTDDAVSVCEVCGAPAQRVLHPVAIHFKGSGFYSTDYGRGKKAAGSAEAKADSGSGSGSDSKSSSSDGAKSGGESKSSGGDSKGGGDAKPAKAAEG
jgi:putative FmdB family regulatory protein